MDMEKVIKGLECCIGQFPGEDYCKTCVYQPYRFGKCKADAITDALALLKKQEAVVRCKDCKYWDSEEHDCNIKIGWFACGADWFCADGDRRDTDA